MWFLWLFFLMMAAAQPQGQVLARKVYYVGAIFEISQKNSPAHQSFLYSLLTLERERSPRSDFQLHHYIEYVDDLSNSFQIASAMCELVMKEVIAIFGPIHPSTVHTVQSLSDSHRVLYITPSDPHHYASQLTPKQRASNILKLKPMIMQTAVDFIHFGGWSRILYLYDSMEALFRLRMLFEYSNQGTKPISADARRLSDMDTADPVTGKSEGRGTLKYINAESQKSTNKYILLDLDQYQSRQQIFAQMEDVKLNRKEYHFVLLNSDPSEVTSSLLLNGGINFTLFVLLDYDSERVKKYIGTKGTTGSHWYSQERIQSYRSDVDDAPIMKDILPYEAALMRDGVYFLNEVVRHSQEYNTSNVPNTMVPCSPRHNPPFTANELKAGVTKTRLEAVSGLMAFDSDGFRIKYRVDIRESRIKQSLMKIGNWTDDSGSSSSSSQSSAQNHQKRLKIERPTGVGGLGNLKMVNNNDTIIITSILVEPFLMNATNNVTGEVIPNEYIGFCKDLITEIAKILNITNYVIKPVNDSNYGAFVNESWNGMIGELTRGMAHMAVAPLTITSSRERVVDFSTPFMEVGLSVMFQKLKKSPPEMFRFMEPLSKEIWMCIAFAYLGVSVVLFLVSRFSPYEWGVHPHSTPTLDSRVSNEFSIFNSFWFSLSAFMQQGGDISPRSLSGRIVGGAWWFFTLIIVSSYTANLAAYLTVVRMSNPIQSYEDLAKQTKIKYGVVNSGSSKEFFEKSKMAVFKKMWQFMESNPDVFVASVEDGYQRVKNSSGDYAFLLESTMNEWFNQKQPCTTTKVGPNLDSGKGYGIATPPGSRWRDSVNLAVLDLKEKNRIPEMINFWWSSQGKCGSTKKSESESLTNSSLDFEGVTGLFVLLGVGLCIGLALSVLEFLYKCALVAKRKQRPFMQVMHEMWYNYAELKMRDREVNLRVQMAGYQTAQDSQVDTMPSHFGGVDGKKSLMASQWPPSVLGRSAGEDQSGDGVMFRSAGGMHPYAGGAQLQNMHKPSASKVEFSF